MAREFEEAVLQAAVDNATIEVPDQLVHARAHELVEQTLTTLARQGISKETYLQIAGKDEHALSEDAEPEAAAALRREAVLAAIVAAEQIEPTDEQLTEALAPAAERDGTDPAELVERLRSNNRLDQLREDVATRQALELLVERATPLSVAQAEARGAIWTPDKEQSGSGSGQIWTPGS